MKVYCEAMMGALRWLALFFLLCLTCGSVHAERRVALLIGNSAYKSVPPLANPVNDAILVGDMFTKAGFDVVDTKLDLGVAEMRKALREFGAKARDAEVAVIYYAGHGIELDGNNYLVPTDATLETDADVFDEAFPLDRVLFAIEPAKQLRLVILDACRDNPFVKTMKRTLASRSLGRGLAKIDLTTPNTMIAFAAKAGSTASDGDSKNSPFSTALVERLPTPGLDLRKAFGFVRDDVLKNTGYKQEPYVYGSLGGDDLPLVPAAKLGPGTSSTSLALMLRDYQLAEQIGTREIWTAFLIQYPDGLYATLAKGHLDSLTSEAQPAKSAPSVELSARPKFGREALVRDIKKELQRVGCYAGAIDEEWTTAKPSAEKFLKAAKIAKKYEQPESDLLDIIQSQAGRVCLTTCSIREIESGGNCIAKTCGAGMTLSNDGSCQGRDKPAATAGAVDRESADVGKQRTKNLGLGDATKESYAVMGQGTIKTGQTATFTARNGRTMTCVGGNNTGTVARRCSWNEP
jgi:hypothetical protein